MSGPFGRRLVVAAIAAVVAVPIFFLAIRALTAWRQGYSWAEMDWEGKGHTSIADFLRAAEVGKRPIDVNGVSCVEYFRYRDGATMRTDCPRGL